MRENLSKTKKNILALLSIEDSDWKRLKRELGVSDPVLAKHLKELEEIGLIGCKINKRDRRKKIYYINREGLKKVVADLLSIYIALDLFMEEKKVLEKCSKIQDLNERRKMLLKEVGKLVGNAFLLGLIGGDQTVDIVLRALKLYSKLTEAQIWIRFDNDVKQAFSEIFTIEDVNKLISYIVGVISDFCKIIKIGERVLSDEKLLVRCHESEKQKFPLQTLEYSKWELNEEVNRLKRFLESIGEENILLKKIIDKAFKNVEITDNDIERFFNS